MHFAELDNLFPSQAAVLRAQAVRPLLEDGTRDPARCLYFMGLRQRPAPVVPGQKRSAVNLNVPVAEFRCQARGWLRL